MRLGQGPISLKIGWSDSSNDNYNSNGGGDGGGTGNNDNNTNNNDDDNDDNNNNVVVIVAVVVIVINVIVYTCLLKSAHKTPEVIASTFRWDCIISQQYHFSQFRKAPQII